MTNKWPFLLVRKQTVCVSMATRGPAPLFCFLSWGEWQWGSKWREVPAPLMMQNHNQMQYPPAVPSYSRSLRLHAPAHSPLPVSLSPSIYSPLPVSLLLLPPLPPCLSIFLPLLLSHCCLQRCACDTIMMSLSLSLSSLSSLPFSLWPLAISCSTLPHLSSVLLAVFFLH